MKTITKEVLKIKLELHIKWLNNEKGEALNLAGYDLSLANLREADLRAAKNNQ